MSSSSTASDEQLYFRIGLNDSWNTLRRVIVEDDTGNVGIGTIVPTTRLEINATAAGNSVLRMTAQNTLDQEIEFWDSVANTENGRIVYDDSAIDLSIINTISSSTANLQFGTSNVIRMVIDGSGNVGIGTTTPTSALNVSGSIGATGSINTSNDICVQGVNCLKNLSTSLDPAKLGSVWARNNTAFWNDTVTQVGIGTATPDRALDLNTGSITWEDAVTVEGERGLYWHTGSGYGIYRDDGPWTSPFPNLTIYFTTGINYKAAYSGHNWYIGSSSPNTRGMTLNATAFTVDTNVLYVDNPTNNVGIGTTSPGQTLTVVGTANITGGLNVTNGLNVLTGNVGIGTATPTRALTVIGDINLTGNIFLLNGSTVDSSITGSFVVGGVNSTWYPVIFTGV